MKGLGVRLSDYDTEHKTTRVQLEPTSGSVIGHPSFEDMRNMTHEDLLAHLADHLMSEGAAENAELHANHKAQIERAIALRGGAQRMYDSYCQGNGCHGERGPM